MAARKTTPKKADKKVTRYTYDDIKEPRIPETGHTPLLPDDEQMVTLPMDNGWSQAITVGKLPAGDERPVVVDCTVTSPRSCGTSDSGLEGMSARIRFCDDTPFQYCVQAQSKREWLKTNSVSNDTYMCTSLVQ